MNNLKFVATKNDRVKMMLSRNAELIAENKKLRRENKKLTARLEANTIKELQKKNRQVYDKLMLKERQYLTFKERYLDVRMSFAAYALRVADNPTNDDFCRISILTTAPVYKIKKLYAGIRDGQ